MGWIPNNPQPSQKMFESRLLYLMRKFDPEKVVFTESESKKIGEIQLPDSLIAKMWQSSCILLKTEKKARIKLLRSEYKNLIKRPETLKASIEPLAKNQGKKIYEKWLELIKDQDWTSFVDELLTVHYDPSYQKSINKHYEHLSEGFVLNISDTSTETFTKLAESIAQTSSVTETIPQKNIL